MKKHLLPCCPSFKRARGNTSVISPLSGVPEITYGAVMQGHVSPRCPPFQRAGGSAPVMHPRSGVPAHQVQCNIPTFEAVLRKNMHLFLERRRWSDNVMVDCFDAVRLFIFFLIL